MGQWIYAIKWALAGVTLIIGSALGICQAIFTPFHPKNSIWYYRVVGPLVLRCLGIKVRVEHPERLPNEKTLPAVLMGNHQHNIDAFVFTQAFHWTHLMIGKKSIRYIPVFGQWFWLCGQILIDREHKNVAHETMNQVEDILREKNLSLYLFPEGTRSKDSQLKSFKKGGFRVAINLQRDIIPVVAFSYKKFLHLNKWRSGEIILRVLPRISTTGLTLADIDMLTKKVHDIIAFEFDKLNLEVQAFRQLP